MNEIGLLWGIIIIGLLLFGGSIILKDLWKELILSRLGAKE